MELIDTHCHLTFEPLNADVPGVVVRSEAAGVTGWVTVGTTLRDSVRAVALAKHYPNMHATVGVHPHDAKDADEDTLAELQRLARHEKVVAVGETGLDFYYNLSDQGAQKEVFAAQLRMAAALGRPVVVHSRNAFDETLEILDRHGEGLSGVVFHCFGGSAEQARAVVERGWHVSFTGVVTFKNAEKAREAARAVPLERLMVETDCPYMTPEPVRKQKPNEPALMVHTARFLAELKAVSAAEFAAATTATARAFFGPTAWAVSL
jgi:TatD DNase family protein